MVDLAALARQMKAIGRKGSGKDYYEQHVAAGIAKGEKRARAPRRRTTVFHYRTGSSTTACRCGRRRRLRPGERMVDACATHRSI